MANEIEPARVKFDLDYAPALESTSIVSIDDEYGRIVEAELDAGGFDFVRHVQSTLT